MCLRTQTLTTVSHLPWLWRSSATKSVCMGIKLSWKCVMPFPLFFHLLATHSPSFLHFDRPPSAFITQLTGPGTPVGQEVPRSLLRKQVQTRLKELVGSWHVIVLHVWEAATIYAFVIESKLAPTEIHGRTFTDSHSTDWSLGSTDTSKQKKQLFWMKICFQKKM